MTANQSSGGSPSSGTPNGAPPGALSGVPAPGGKPRSWLRGGTAGPGNVQTFRSPTALVVWVVWLLFAVGNWVDLAVQGRDHTSVVAAALLLVATGIAYVTAQRPRIIADDTGVTIRNPLRDHRIGWAGVIKVDLVDLLRVHCSLNPGTLDPGAVDPAAAGGKKDRKVISAWAVHYSRRRRLTAEVRSRRGPGSRRSSFGLPSGGGRGLGYGDMVSGPAPASSASTAEADAEMVVRLLSERATAAHAELVWATGTVDIAHPADPADPASPVPAAGPAGWLDPLKSAWSTSAIAALLIPALILLVICLV
ncbi:MAG: PH domain-containing protein [Streptosporangiaceae bacterium]|jgi:hypothetical protein